MHEAVDARPRGGDCVGLPSSHSMLVRSFLQGTVLIKNAAELENYSKSEESKLEEYIKNIASTGVKVSMVLGHAVAKMPPMSALGMHSAACVGPAQCPAAACQTAQHNCALFAALSLASIALASCLLLLVCKSSEE